MVLELELVRANAMADAARKALAVFLLTASSALRLVRAYGDGDGWRIDLRGAGQPSGRAGQRRDRPLHWRRSPLRTGCARGKQMCFSMKRRPGVT